MITNQTPWKPLATLLTFIAAGMTCAQKNVCPPDAPANLKPAAKEIRRYVWLRTGEMLRLSSGPANPADPRINRALDSALDPQAYRLKSDGRSLTISGGSDLAGRNIFLRCLVLGA
jgi:hypothetical protein